jgi:acyl-coenzyme A synthetase/AMP-(fatty) acid ligase
MMTEQPPTPDPQAFTCSWVAHHARLRPDGVAVIHLGVHVNWRTLAAAVIAATDALSDIGLGAGQTLGIELDDRYLHLVIMLAAECLGATTISLDTSELGPPASLGRLCDRILLSRPILLARPVADAPSGFLVTPDWAVAVLTRPADDNALDRLHRAPDPDMMLRLMKTSGTTGLPKVMGMTQRLLLGQIDKMLLKIAPEIAAQPAFLCLYRFTMRAAHTRCMLTLRRGGTVHFTGADALWDTVAAGIGNYLYLLPGDLERFVRTAPGGHGRHNLHIDVTGGAVSPSLWAETRAKLGVGLCVTYSTNEVHHIALVNENQVGRLFADARVRIVDDRGEALPPGATGLIQVQTATMIEGYVGTPELTEAVFAGGWCHTADFGYQPDRDTLVVLGRADDMLNIGGVKLAPGPVEAQLRTIPGVSGALVTDLGDRLETGTLLVAIEVAAGANAAGTGEADARQAEIGHRVEQLIRGYRHPFRVLVVPALPRTETGKIRRDAVRELARDRRAEH